MTQSPPVESVRYRAGHRAHRNRAHRLAYASQLSDTGSADEAVRDNLPLIGRVAVTGVERLSPTFMRIEFGGTHLAHFGVEGSPLYDQRVKLVFPPASGLLPELEPHPRWPSQWAGLREDQPGHMRTFTVRGVRGSGVLTRLVIDFVLHLAPGFTGPASRWAATAKPGDEVLLVAPRRGVPFGGIEFAPPAGTSLLLAGDETAVPAISSILASLPDGSRGVAFLEVPKPLDILHARCPVGMKVVWLTRQGARPGSRLVPVVAAHVGSGGGRLEEEADPAYDVWETPAYSSSGEKLDVTEALSDRPYVWVAGESSLVTSLRRLLGPTLGLSRQQGVFMGYWRHGVQMRD